MNVRLVSYTPEPLLVIASAAAITRGIQYDEVKKWPRQKQEALVNRCYESGHWSIFEFADFDFEVSGVSRVFETQCVRSRLASYEWETGRRDQSYIPCDFSAEISPDGMLCEAINKGIQSYKDLLVRHSPEVARYALPQGVARKARIKRNLRNMMETAHLRLCSHAAEEYRKFMNYCKDEISKVDSFLGSLLVPECKYLGYCRQYRSCHLDGVLSKGEALKGNDT